jgi:hypothetical protein
MNALHHLLTISLILINLSPLGYGQIPESRLHLIPAPKQVASKPAILSSARFSEFRLRAINPSGWKSFLPFCNPN